MLLNELEQRIAAARYREQHGNGLTKKERVDLVNFFRTWHKNNQDVLAQLPMGFEASEEYDYIVNRWLNWR